MAALRDVLRRQVPMRRLQRHLAAATPTVAPRIINRCPVLRDRVLIVMTALTCRHGAQHLLDRLNLLSYLTLTLVAG